MTLRRWVRVRRDDVILLTVPGHDEQGGQEHEEALDDDADEQFHRCWHAVQTSRHDVLEEADEDGGGDEDGDEEGDLLPGLQWHDKDQGVSRYQSQL